jgi:uncharacterized protein YneF (UPF0154 family)
MGKRGEVTSSQLVIWISLIVSFLVIVFVMGQIFLDNELTESQVCKTSVLARDAANTRSDVFQGSKYLPLNCQTTKTCLGDGRCKEDFIDTKSSPVTKIKFNSEDPVEIQNEILDVYSESILNCHVKMGEGHANFLPANFGKTSYCIICSRISIDESLKNSAPESVSYFNVFEKMERKSFEGKSYLERVYDVKSADKISIDYHLAKKVEGIEEIEGYSGNVESLRKEIDKFDSTFDPREEQAVIMKVVKKGDWLSTLLGGGLATAAVSGGTYLSFTGAGAIIGVPVALLGVAAGGITYVFTNYNEKYSYHAPTLTKYDVDELNEIGCNSFEHLP